MSLEDKIAALNKSTPKHVDLFVRTSMDVVDVIHAVMEEKGMTQKDLAKKLGKHEAEVSKWLNGVQNYTLKTLCKLQAALDEEFVQIEHTSIGKESFKFEAHPQREIREEAKVVRMFTVNLINGGNPENGRTLEGRLA